MKWILATLTLFAIGCYAQQPVQYVPVPQEKDAPPPTIITVPQNQPQPARPIIIQPFRRDHEFNRHGTNEPTPATTPSSATDHRTLFRFADFTPPETPRETLVEIGVNRPGRTQETVNAATVTAEVCSIPPATPRCSPRHGYRDRLKERLSERLHRSKR